MPSIEDVPGWYIGLSVAIALFHVARGAVGQIYLNPARALLNERWMRVILVSTFAGSAALWFSYLFAVRSGEVAQIGNTVAILSLVVFGVAGITGVLATALAGGKIPTLK